MSEIQIAQRAKQSMQLSQTMKLGMQQQLSLKLLSLPVAELREEIYTAISRNPALEIADDPFQDGIERTQKNAVSRLSDYERYSSTSASGEKASDDFLNALESNADKRTSLSDHLFHQINAMNLSDSERELCTLLIQNLNGEGHHILAPVSLLDKMNPRPNESFLEHCISIVQKLDPVGVCVTNTIHSLLVQAKDKKNAPDSALFILNGHFDFLDPPIPSKIAKKANRFFAEQKKLEFDSEKKEILPDFTEKDAQIALDFIRTLDPHPAREFGFSGENFALPDVFVEEVAEKTEDDSPKILADNSVLISTEKGSFKISLAKGNLPILKISEDFLNFKKSANTEQEKAEEKFAKESVISARTFIDGVEFRESTLLKATAQIVLAQSAFFRQGARFLVPLRQKDVAAAIGVHESTISRMANGKFLSCAWGVFPLSHFFTNAVNEETVRRAHFDSLVGENAPPASKEGVKAEIEKILLEHKNDKKPLSDQKISDILNERGIKIARRTVAKYRSELNVASSFSRV